MTTLASFFENVRLPTISAVAHSLVATLDNEDTTTRSVATIISRDPALTAKLMRLANSARFGSSRNVSSLDDAIALAGMSHIRTLALAACFADAFPQLPGLDTDEFWKSSMACAGYAKWLANGAGADSNEAWLAGMIMRLGELLIYQVAPSAFAEIEQLPHLPGARWEREQRLLGLSEGQITAELCRRWNFPARIVAAVERSSDPMVVLPFCKLAGVVHLASLLADTPSDDPAILDTLPADVVGALSLSMEWMRARFPSHASFAAAA
ncbi:HDOD domain-containing protein [Massilia yuzhufengensis]|uniref:HD-like signal output (HDOD) domain, no enzymatic activity n=1 Tax=Massilia yuzhufengensis TaxID=1164594 RepID=A0A1I1VQH4_9BURK|nr:HDOD domain-containing protein [Massilia yuzhufengensis]SFD85297.1 HD-like signal output (HDOD) domain, no enzymatic activity [Massilia yuzhufengensis]